MYFRQYYLGCLSHASYLIGDERTGRAVVVDPQRDVDGYLDDAAAAGLKIERVIETHFHADFVSGHLELADRTGATIWYGDGPRPTSRSACWATASASNWATSPSRCGPLPATRPSPSAWWSTTDPPKRRPTAFSPETRCSSATWVVPTCCRRWASPPRTWPVSPTARSTTSS